ncbi:unnamed protein product [Rhodiola kirilowii]
MAAAHFSRNLIRLSTSLHTPPPPRRIFAYRNQSNKPIEDPDMESDSASSVAADPSLTDLDHLLALRRIESAMHQILVKKSTPGWLPFVPGGSYWVPPVSSNKSNSVAEMVEKSASSLKKEEKAAARNERSVRTERGWPSKAYFFRGKDETLVKQACYVLLVSFVFDSLCVMLEEEKKSRK